MASVLHGNIGGALQVNVDLKGAVINAGAAEGGAEVDACQSVALSAAIAKDSMKLILLFVCGGLASVGC